MNDGKIIIDKIIEKAEAEAVAIKKKGRQEADELLRSAAERAKKEEDLLKKKGRDEAERAKAKEISGAELQGKIALLEEKQRILDEVIAEAAKRLSTLSDEEYAKVVGNMLARLNKSDGEEVIVSQKDRERLAAVIAEKGFKLLEETRDLDGGFILKNGDIEYNYSFASIIAVEQEEIRQIAASILF